MIRYRRTFSTLLALLLLALPCPPLVSAQGRPWTVEDALSFLSPRDLVLSPDGGRVAFVVTSRDLEGNRNLSDIWVAATDGSGPAYALTRGARDARSPEWSPDGSWLAFLSERDSAVQVQGIRPGGGEAWPVTDVKEDVLAFDISPDGERIAYSVKARESAEEKRQHARPMVWDSAYSTDWTELRVAPLAEGVASEGRRVSGEGQSVTGFVWAPDSRRLAWSAVGMADSASFGERDRTTGFSRAARLYVGDASASGGAPAARLAGRLGVEAWVGGLGIVVSASAHELGTYNRRLWLVAPDGASAPASLTDGLDENARYVAADAGTLLVEAQARTGAGLYRIPLSGGGAAAGPPERITPAARINRAFTATPDLARIAFLVESATEPPDVYAAAPAGAARRLTTLNPQVAELAQGEQKVVRWKSAYDGEEIEGVLTLPVGYREGERVPLLLVIHGGPSGVSADGFNPGGRYPIQVFAGLGYASLQPNYRGSTGYGERFRGLNRGHISEADWIDVNSGVDHLVEAGIADPDRLGIMGWSFGGHHTFWGITHTTRFKAASAGAGANDLISMYSQTDLPGFYHTYLGPKPWQDFDLYEKRSAYRFVADVTTPLLIQVGEKDERVPAEQSIEFYEAMSAIGRAPVKLVIYPGEGHGFREVVNVRDVMERNVEWFTRWIPSRAAAASSESK